MTTKYRLPDWLGGHEAHIQASFGGGRVEVWVRDHESTVLNVALRDLIEVKPPSIDDPVTLPLSLRDGDGVRLIVEHYALDRLGTVARVRVSDDGALSIDLTAEQSRDLARAAWLLGTREAS